MSIAQLKQRLRKLTKEEVESAVEYVNECFDEADEEHDQEVIERLGKPNKFATLIIADTLVMEEEYGKPKKRHSILKTIGLIFLGICALPIGFPAVIMKKNSLKVLLIVSGVFCLTGLLLSGGGYLMAYWYGQRSHMLSPGFWYNWNRCWNHYAGDTEEYWGDVADGVEEYWDAWGADFEDNFDEFEEQFENFGNRFENGNVQQGCHNLEYMKQLCSTVESLIVLPKELEQLKFENVVVELLFSKFELAYGEYNEIELDNIDADDELSFLMYKDDDTLHIVERGSERDKKITLTLGMEIQELNVDGLSGNVLIQGGMYQKLLLLSTSGNLMLNRVTSGHVSSSLTSGKVVLDEARIAELNVDLTNGSLKGNGNVSER